MGPVDRLHQDASLSDDVYRRLKEYILNEVIRPPDRLQIGQLSRHFGVSITPIREALIRLATENIVESKSGRGFFYKEFIPGEQIKIYELLFCLLEYLLGRRGSKPLPLSSDPELSPVASSPQDHRLTPAIMAAVVAREKLYMQIASSCGNEQFGELVGNLCERTRVSRILALEQLQDNRRAMADNKSLVSLLQAGENQQVTKLLQEQFRAKTATMHALANERQRRIYDAYPLLRPGLTR